MWRPLKPRRLVWDALMRLPASPKRHLLYLAYQRRWGHFRSPRTFTEKVNWRILYDRRPVLTTTCDKLAMKEIALAADVAVPKTLWHGTDFVEAASVELPDRWVIKPNHRSGVIHFGSGPRVRTTDLANLAEQWMPPEEERKAEWAYSAARRELLIEEFLGSVDSPPDYKFFVFDGEPVLIQVDEGRFNEHRRRFYEPDWSPLDVRSTCPMADVAPPPPNLGEMSDAASRIGSGYDFIRVDLYSVEGQLYFGELTPYPGGGLERWLPRSYDDRLGTRWRLPTTDEPPRFHGGFDPGFRPGRRMRRRRTR